MYKIFIEKQAFDKFDMFLKYQQMTCIYRWTGLFNEEEIIKEKNILITDLIIKTK